MPKAWSKKDERQYQHVKHSEEQRGKSASRAKQLHIGDRSRMTKAELVEAIRSAR